MEDRAWTIATLRMDPRHWSTLHAGSTSQPNSLICPSHQHRHSHGHLDYVPVHCSSQTKPKRPRKTHLAEIQSSFRASVNLDPSFYTYSLLFKRVFVRVYFRPISRRLARALFKTQDYRDTSRTVLSDEIKLIHPRKEGIPCAAQCGHRRRIRRVIVRESLRMSTHICSKLNPRGFYASPPGGAREARALHPQD
ncbi:hypothetical protein B0H17DRAFT_1095077 [Mycena rosella]|uniref:Uncharacterized protein n=1 Tax=Mycena rosella TaxID=1033263 RepID=A0AAD7CT16_MYCRO|nr:hypothetical protein B0H17DRAFT_1095077 [Mycena rosella]